MFPYFSVNPSTPASRWHRLLKLKRKKKNYFKIITGFFFTPPLFLATKVAISFVYYSPKTIKCTQKPKMEKKKKFTGIDQSCEYHSPHHIYNSLLRMRAIQEFKIIILTSGPFDKRSPKRVALITNIWGMVNTLVLTCLFLEAQSFPTCPFFHLKWRRLYLYSSQRQLQLVEIFNFLS